MPKINKEEYEVLKSLDDEWRWIARDGIGNSLYAYLIKPYKRSKRWIDIDGGLTFEQVDKILFQFIKWEDEEPYNIQELIEEYENSLIKSTPWTPNPLDFESEEKEMSFKKKLKKEVEEIMTVTDYERGNTIIKKIGVDDLFDLIDQLDEPEPKNISLQDVTNKLWELPSNNRKDWLEHLNDEFQEGYIVPLGLKTTDGEEQYLTFHGSYFACRRNRDLQQMFGTLEEIPEFYRDLAERVL